MKRHTFALVFALAFSTTAQAQIDQDKIYVGGGLGYNSLSGWDSAVGFQIFAGHELDDIYLGSVRLEAVELGYMDSGTFENTVFGTRVETEASGLWAAALFTYPINPGLKAIGRAGLDFGDDDGLLVGVGVDYSLGGRSSVRAEYVDRSNIGSLQANYVHRF